MLTGRSLARERGFTLIELLIVVTVLAVSLALVLPSFSGLRHNAQDRAAQASLVNAEKLAHSIALESGEFPGTDDAVVDGEMVRHKELEGDCDSHEFQDQPGSGW